MRKGNNRGWEQGSENREQQRLGTGNYGGWEQGATEIENREQQKLGTETAEVRNREQKGFGTGNAQRLRTGNNRGW